MPLVCAALFYGGGMRTDHSRPDELRRPPGTPRARVLRRLSTVGAGLGPARALAASTSPAYLRVVKLLPIRSAAVIRLVEIVRLDPELELGAFLTRKRLDVRQRAAELGLSDPRRAGDLDRGEYGDLLWRGAPGAGLRGEPFDPALAEHGSLAAGDFRALVEEVRRGGVLHLYPEGRPSPDGEIGRSTRPRGARSPRPTELDPAGRNRL